MIEKWKTFVKNKNNLLVIVLAGVLFMVISLPVENKKENSGNEEDSQAESQINNSSSFMNENNMAEEKETEQYVNSMEQKVAELLCQMEGAGKVKVIITLRTSVEKIVEKDMPVTRSNTIEEDSEGGTRTVNAVDTGDSTIYTTSGSESKPYVIKTISPQVEGVLVLAEGAGNGGVSKNLSDAIQVLFGIEAHRVKIIKMECTK